MFNMPCSICILNLSLQDHVRQKISVTTIKSNHQMYSVKIGVLKNFANFKGKHLCLGILLIKLQELQLYYLKFY